MSQWIKGECDAVPGKTMPNLKVVKRDYKNVYKQFTSYGPLVRQNGLGAHGTSYAVADEYDEYIQTHRTETWDGNSYPSLDRDEDVCNAILHLATVSNGDGGQQQAQQGLQGCDRSQEQDWPLRIRCCG